MRKSAPIGFGTLRARLPLAGAGQRIGLMGGSFNPPHAGHRAIALTALKRLRLDRVWWLVTPGNPLKSHGMLLSLAARVEMARAVADDRRIVVTDLEERLASSFTAGTLAHLGLRRPEVRFVWVMGADSLAGFHHWHDWRGIFRAMPIAVVDRPGWRLKALASPAAGRFRGWRVAEDRAAMLADMEPPCWTFLTGPLVDLSSTQLRATWGHVQRDRSRPDGAATNMSRAS
jgi:nicotinate-nucleotide adenylyltransferase